VRPCHDDVFGSAHCVRRIHINDLANDEPVNEHADCSKAPLYRRFGKALAKALDVARDIHGLHVRQIVHTTALRAEFQNLTGRAVVRPPRVLVPDVRCEEIEESLGRPLLSEKQGTGLGPDIGQTLKRDRHHDLGG
jgi:hypothetical protein